MKADPEFDQMGDHAFKTTQGELRSFIERIERLNAEKQDVADQTKDVFAEAKERGYDTKAMRQIVIERKQDKDDLAEFEAVMDMYRDAVGR